MALSYPGHLSAASERRRCVMNTKPKWERESWYRTWVVKGIGNRIGQGKISSVFLRWPHVSYLATCELAVCPALNWHLISSACVKAPREYLEWQVVCLGLHMPHLSSPYSFSSSQSQPLFPPSTHTHTRVPLVFFLSALRQFPPLVLKRFEIAFGPEALAISN